jgi:hypothetical protein
LPVFGGGFLSRTGGVLPEHTNMGTLRPYRRNHTLPESMLRCWVVPGMSDALAYKIADKCKRRWRSHGRRGFGFAIEEDLYIPELEGERATTMERWFKAQEDALLKLTRTLRTGTDPYRRLSESELDLALMCILGFEHRSLYNLNLVRGLIERDPKVRTAVTANPERDAKRLTLEAAIMAITEMTHRLAPMEMIPLECTSGSWILCDRPYIVSEELDHRFVVLTNKMMLAYRRSPDGIGRCKPRKAVPRDFQTHIIRMLALNARSWLLADTEAELDTAIAVVESDEWRKQLAQDAPRLMRPVFLMSGWSIRADQR